MDASEKEEINIPKGASALIIDDEGMSLMIPDVEDENGNVPDHAVFLSVIGMRYQTDPEWVQEQFDWFTNRLEGDEDDSDDE